VNILEEYISACDHQSLIRSEYEAARQTVLKTVEQDLADIAAEFEPSMQSAAALVAALEPGLRDMAIKVGETIKNERVSIIPVAGRVTWDTKALDGYAVANPAVERFRKVGEPTTQIRWAK